MDDKNSGTWYTKTRVNDDFTSNKKKNKGKRFNNSEPASANSQKSEVSPQETKNLGNNPIANLQSMFPTFDKDTLLDIYEQNSKNFDRTVDLLRDLTGDAKHSEPKSASPEGGKQTSYKFETPEDFVESPGKGDYNMLQEHDDLCDQVSEILDSAFDRSDIGEDDIQELLDMCEENVCFVIEEEQRLRQPKEEEFEVDQITKEVQEFILKAIQNEQKQTIVNTSLSNFPSLNSSNWKEESYTASTPFAKIIHKENSKKVNKIQPNIPDKWGNEPNNQIHAGMKPGSTREIILLCKHFPSLPLSEIKTVYTLLDEDYEFSMKFLREKRRSAFQSVLNKPKPAKKIVRVSNNSNAGGYEESKVRHDETVEQILRDYTYREIRETVQRLTRIKCILDRTATQARGSRKYSEIARIEGAARDQTQQLDKFSRASKKYVLDQARKNREFYGMDLHGLYWDEAREVVTEQINYLSRMADTSKGQFSYVDRIKNGQRCMEYSIITGKGMNSRNNVPVLYNNLVDFLKEKRLAHTPSLLEGRVIVFIPI